MKSLAQHGEACLLTALITLFALSVLTAEGTRQLAPNQSIIINGFTSNDVAALHIANPQFNNFGAYNNANITSRLNIHISDPASECIYLGFSEAHLNRTTPNPPSQDFEYRILDPDGNIIFGPVTILQGQASISNWSEAFNGPAALAGPSGYTGQMVSSADLTSSGWTGEGDYYIEFRNLSSADPFLIDYWDITVVDCSMTTPQEKTGRVWSYNWALFAINDFGFPNRPFNGSFYVCAPDPQDQESAFITRIDFDGSGFRPAAFNVAFNSFGTMNTGNIVEDRRSVERMNLTEAEYAIFLNDPIDICETAEGGDISLLGISSCDGEDFCIKFISTRAGQIDLFLDFDGRDNIFTPGTADLMITANVDASEVGQELCLEWDGRNGLGDDLSGMQVEVPVNFSFAQGIYHFPIYDAELMTTGFQIEAVRPQGQDPLLYYDDSNISVPSGTGEAAVQLAGCSLPCHGWTNYTDPGAVGFGNLNTINSWWFSTRQSFESVFIMPGQLECIIEGPSSLCQGDTIAFAVIHEIKPAGSNFQIISQRWTESSTNTLVAEDVDSIDVTEAGDYVYSFQWVNAAGDTCDQLSCSIEVTEFPSYTVEIDTLLGFGDSLVINGEVYSQEGSYVQNLLTDQDCDSIIIIDVGYNDPVYSCEVIGESQICDGDQTLLELIISQDPPNLSSPPLEEILWSGPGVNQTMVSELLASEAGNYSVQLSWFDSAGEQQNSFCEFELEVFPSYFTSIDTLITEGDTLKIQGINITEPGEYIQEDLTLMGCDSTLVVNVISQNAVVRYDFEDCRSVDYDLLVADYPSPLICGEFTGSDAYRVDPTVNAHSCTPGFDGGVAMCVSSLDSCDYVAGDPKSLIFDIEVIPSPDSAIQITSIDFYERAPEEFQWIVGYRGLNNYPVFYGLRVLRDGQEIYRSIDNPTNREWTREIFSFSDTDAFRVDAATSFSFEFLPYCLSGVDSNVTAWDIDALSIQASCAVKSTKKQLVSGTLTSVYNQPLENFELRIKETVSGISIDDTKTNRSGEYAFNPMYIDDYILEPVSPDNYTAGVSALDLIHIQRHILGIRNFDSPHDYIAADADGSRTITAMDILQLQRLILGIEDRLPNNNAWLFNVSKNELSLDYPWNIKSEYSLERYENNISYDFEAIKVGDVNGDYHIDTQKSVGQARHMDIHMGDQDLEPGQELRINLGPKEFGQSYVGFQLAFNIEGLEFEKIGSSTGMVQAFRDRKLLKILYVDSELENETKSSGYGAELVFKVKAEGRLSDFISLAHNWKNQLYDHKDFVHHINGLYFNKVEAEAIRISPNPFSEEFDIVINAQNSRQASFSIFDMSGKKLYENRIQIAKGVNSFNLKTTDIGVTDGLLMLLINDGIEIRSYKIIKL